MAQGHVAANEFRFQHLARRMGASVLREMGLLCPEDGWTGLAAAVL